MQIAQGTFRRVSPASFAEKVGLPMGWIVVRHDHVAEKLNRRKTHGRWVSVKSAHGKVYRVLRYSVNLQTSQIVMDWVGWIDLQGRTDQETEEVPLTISTARFWEHLVIPFKHIDPGYRMSAWLGAISVALGALSVILSIVLSGG